MILKIIFKFSFISLISLFLTLSKADTFKVGAESLQLANDKFSTSGDFKKMARKVIFEPMYKHQVWGLKILDFQPLNGKFDYHNFHTFKRPDYKGWLPFMLTFKASATKEYYNSVMQFAAQNFQISSDKDRYSLINFVKLYAKPMIAEKNAVQITTMIRKSYKMSEEQKDIFSSLFSEYWDNLGKNLGLVVSLYNKDGLFKKSAYLNDMRNPKSNTDFAREPKNRMGFPMYERVLIDTHGELNIHRSGQLRAIYKDHNYNFSINDFTFVIVLLLNKEDVAQLTEIKINFEKVNYN